MFNSNVQLSAVSSSDSYGKPPETDAEKIARLEKELVFFKKYYALASERLNYVRNENIKLELDNEWISVAEKLPEVEIRPGYALVCFSYRGGFCGSVTYYKDNNEWWSRVDSDECYQLKDVILWKYIKLPEFK